MCVRLHTWPCVLRSQGGQTKNQIRRALNLFRADLTEVEDSDMGELSSDEGELSSESEEGGKEGGGRGETATAGEIGTGQDDGVEDEEVEEDTAKRGYGLLPCSE